MSAGFLRILAGVFAFVAILLAFAGWRLGRDDGDNKVIYVPAIDNRLESGVVDSGHPALVAMEDLLPGQRPNSGNTAIVMYPTPFVDGFASPGELPDAKLLRSVEAGQVLRSEDFHSDLRLSQAVADGKRAVAISFDELTGVGGHLSPGDRVDVLYGVSAPNANNSFGVRRIFSALPVLGVGPRFSGDEHSLAEDSNSRNQRQTARTAVLEVDENLAPLLVLAESTGRLRLALIGEGEVSDISAAVAALSAETLSKGLDSDSLHELMGEFVYLQDAVRDEQVEAEIMRAEQDASSASREVILHVGGQRSSVSLPVKP